MAVLFVEADVKDPEEIVSPKQIGFNAFSKAGPQPETMTQYLNGDCGGEYVYTAAHTADMLDQLWINHDACRASEAHVQKGDIRARIDQRFGRYNDTASAHDVNVNHRAQDATCFKPVGNFHATSRRALGFSGARFTLAFL
ncbi:MAG: hypothetical protein AAB217_21380 [Chloroflexota bacterium]